MNPDFTRALAASGELAASPLVVMDVGALGGFNPRWEHFGVHMRAIGFEPQGQQVVGERQSVYPFAIGRQRGMGQIHIARSPFLSSFLPVAQSWRDRSCVFHGNAEVVRVEEIPLIDIDSFCDEFAIDRVDFLKIDTEGTELDVLEGAARTLDRSVLGIEIEVFFHETHPGRAVFAEIDAWMRGKGFTLFDLTPWRFCKTALPNLDETRHGKSVHGQVVGGDALYLRDPIAGQGIGAGLTPAALAKLVALMELWDMRDCAFELLQWAGARGQLSPTLLGWADLLVPPVLGRRVSNEVYQQLAKVFG